MDRRSMHIHNHQTVAFTWERTFMEVTLLHFDAGKKRKDQHDANLAGMGVNPAYAGAYGSAPAVSFFALIVYFLVNDKDLLIC